MDKIVSLCKRRGFVFPGSEIYGGLANSWDYGPYGTELMNNIRNHWWNFFVQRRSDMVGLESTVIMNPKVWKASGHLGNFYDYLIECKKCHNRIRPDILLSDEDNLILASKIKKINTLIEKGKTGAADQLDNVKKINKEIQQLYSKIKCPTCSESNWTMPAMFNLMFQTSIGPNRDLASVVYLRPEMAQGMFVDFPRVVESNQIKIPFGIAQIGKCFRNEVTTGQFIFRLREFNLMELEYFIHPSNWKKLFEMWVDYIKEYHKELGLNADNLIWHEIPAGERAHYSKRTIDIEYKFPFGTKELHAIAYRTDYDLKAHQEVSGKDLSYTDRETGEKYIPHVVEPTFGADRTLFAVMCAAYHEEEAPAVGGGTETRVVLKIPKHLAPVKVAVLPLSKKEELAKVARNIWENLRPHFMAEYHSAQSIGKRYRRQDEIGTPYCVTVDFETLKDNAVTVRDRDTMKQERIKTEELENYLSDKLK